MKDLIAVFDHVLEKMPDASRIEVSGRDGIKIVAERTAAAPASAAPVVQAVAVSAPAAQPPEKAEVGRRVLSPIVGTFYTAPTPESDAFVKLGDTVKKGQPLCIIEAMKMMNEIESEFDGTVTQICAENGALVEYGQPLFVLEV